MTATEVPPTPPTGATAGRVARRVPGWGSSVAVHALALGTLAIMATRGQPGGEAVAGPVTLALAPADAPADPPLDEETLPALRDAPLPVEPVEVGLPDDPPPPSEELTPTPVPPRAPVLPPAPPPVDRYSLARIPRIRPAAAPAAVAEAPAPLVPPRALATAVAYPRALRDDAPTGVVQLRLLVRADGSVGDVRIHETSGVPGLDRAAAEAARVWRFEPATRGGVAVDAWVEVPVRFA